MRTLHPSNAPAHAPDLSERLFAIAQRVPKDCVVCDVGSDHGALPLYLLKTGKCRRAIVTDLNELPLKRAKKALSDEKLDHLAEFVLSDGLENTTVFSPDVYVIAGMGGETIAGILCRGMDSISVGTRFFVQPMTREETLRRFLYENGFRIDHESIICENGKAFPVFFTCYDKTVRIKDDFFYKFGEFLPKDKSSDVFFYWKKKLSKLTVKKEGRLRAGKDVSVEVALENSLLSLLEEYNENL